MKSKVMGLIENMPKKAWIGLAAATAGIVLRSAYRELTKFEVRNKTVLITGGSRGLGLALARRLAKKGANLAICARDSRQLERARKELESLNVKVLTVKADVTSQAEVRDVVAHVADHFGGIDVVINNAGTMTVGPENVMEVSDFKKVMETNTWSALYMVREVIPHFLRQGGGRIVNIVSIGGKIAVPHMLPYSVSKFALAGLSEGLAAELRKDNIIVTTVVPNLMRTGSPRNVSLKGDHEAEYAWFRKAASSGILAQKATSAASKIVSALEHGTAQLVLTPTARMAITAKSIAPNILSRMMQQANRFMPVSNARNVRKGYELERLGLVKKDRAAEKQALAFNEV